MLITDEQSNIISKEYKNGYKNYLTAIDAVNGLIALYTQNVTVTETMVLKAVNTVNEHSDAIRYGVLPFLFCIKNICIGKNPELELTVFRRLAAALENFYVAFQSVLEDNEYE